MINRSPGSNPDGLIFARGEIFSYLPLPAVFRNQYETFLTPGEVVGNRPCTCLRHTHAQAFRRLASAWPEIFVLFRKNFPHSFTAVARVAQALKVAGISEPAPVATVWFDVVHLRGPHPWPVVCSTFPAERLPEQLVGPHTPPCVRAVHPVPGRTLRAAFPLRAVLEAPSVPRQLRAAGMPARPERFTRHGLSPPSKKINRHRQLQPRGVIGTGYTVSTGHQQY